MSQAVTLSIRKIIILDDKYPDTMEATVTLDPDSTVAHLREILCSQNIMNPVDAFMFPSEPEFALAKVDEEYKSWTSVQDDKNVRITYIGLLGCCSHAFTRLLPY
jgi:hypothetical protein